MISKAIFSIFLMLAGINAMSVSYKSSVPAKCPLVALEQLKFKYRDIVIADAVYRDEAKRLKFLYEVFSDFISDLGFDASFLELPDCRQRLHEFIHTFKQEAISHHNPSPQCEKPALTAMIKFETCSHVKRISETRPTLTPTHRAFAKCVCRNCVGSLQPFPFSESVCMPVTTLMPALEMGVSPKSFNFILEEVPTSCACQATFNG